MPSYPFRKGLIEKVIADPQFRVLGRYAGNWRRLSYLVVDPRRHDVDVWKRESFEIWESDEKSLTKRRIWYGYMQSAMRGNFKHFTNGPFMAPLSFSSSDAAKYLATGVMLATAEPTWIPYGKVIAGSEVQTEGSDLMSGGAAFGRRGSGRLSHYFADKMELPADTIAGMDGLTLLVDRAGNINTDPFTLHVNSRSGCGAWALVPIDPVELGDEWIAESEYLRPSDDEDVSTTLDGVIVAAASSVGGWNSALAGALKDIGARGAVAIDPSDSVVWGARTSVDIPCSHLKDKMQTYGFCVP